VGGLQGECLPLSQPPQTPLTLPCFTPGEKRQKKTKSKPRFTVKAESKKKTVHKRGKKSKPRFTVKAEVKKQLTK